MRLSTSVEVANWIAMRERRLTWRSTCNKFRFWHDNAFHATWPDRTDRNIEGGPHMTHEIDK